MFNQTHLVTLKYYIWRFVKQLTFDVKLKTIVNGQCILCPLNLVVVWRVDGLKWIC